MLTNFHPVPLHLPSILLVHGPHVTIKQARRIRDHVSTAAVERKEFLSWEVGAKVDLETQTSSG